MNPTVIQRAIRSAWAHDAQRQGLTQAAAFWRWKALNQEHPVYWLKRPWKEEACPITSSPSTSATTRT